MLIQNVNTKLGLANDMTTTVVGFVFCTAPGAHPILETLDVSPTGTTIACAFYESRRRNLNRSRIQLQYPTAIR